MDRRIKMVKLASHPINSKLFEKLTIAEYDFVSQFLTEHDNTPDNEFMEKANRLFVDDRIKPKHHSDMWAIIIQCK